MLGSVSYALAPDNIEQNTGDFLSAPFPLHTYLVKNHVFFTMGNTKEIEPELSAFVHPAVRQ